VANLGVAVMDRPSRIAKDEGEVLLRVPSHS
jgi:hypothetical protein